MAEDDGAKRPYDRRGDHGSVDRRAWLTVAIFFAGFGGMIWAIGSAIGLF